MFSLAGTHYSGMETKKPWNYAGKMKVQDKVDKTQDLKSEDHGLRTNFLLPKTFCSYRSNSRHTEFINREPKAPPIALAHNFF